MKDFSKKILVSTHIKSNENNLNQYSLVQINNDNHEYQINYVKS